MRRRRFQFECPIGHKLHRVTLKRIKAKALAQQSKQRRGGGGLWRALIHERCKFGQKAMFKQVPQEYKAWSLGMKRKYSEFGQAGSKAHKVGGGPLAFVGRAFASAVKDAILSQRSAFKDELAILPKESTAHAMNIPASGLAEALKTFAADADLQVHPLSRAVHSTCQSRERLMEPRM